MAPPKSPRGNEMSSSSLPIGATAASRNPLPYDHTDVSPIVLILGPDRSCFQNRSRVRTGASPTGRTSYAAPTHSGGKHAQADNRRDGLRRRCRSPGGVLSRQTRIHGGRGLRQVDHVRIARTWRFALSMRSLYASQTSCLQSSAFWPCSNRLYGR